MRGLRLAGARVLVEERECATTMTEGGVVRCRWPALVILVTGVRRSRIGSCSAFRAWAGTIKRKVGHLVDALALRGDEGRGTLRKALGSCEQALIQGYPNGATHGFMPYRMLNP